MNSDELVCFRRSGGNSLYLTFKTKKKDNTIRGKSNPRDGFSGLIQFRLGKVAFCQSFSECWMEIFPQYVLIKDQENFRRWDTKEYKLTEQRMQHHRTALRQHHMIGGNLTLALVLVRCVWSQELSLLIVLLCSLCKSDKYASAKKQLELL